MCFLFFFNDTATTEIYTLSLHDALPIWMLNTNGQFLNAAFQVNQFTDNNQRNPAIAALTNGNFVIAWVSENQTVSGAELFLGANRAAIYARIFHRAGAPKEDDVVFSTSSNVPANP